MPSRSSSLRARFAPGARDTDTVITVLGTGESQGHTRGLCIVGMTLRACSTAPSSIQLTMSVSLSCPADVERQAGGIRCLGSLRHGVGRMAILQNKERATLRRVTVFQPALPAFRPDGIGSRLRRVFSPADTDVLAEWPTDDHPWAKPVGAMKPLFSGAEWQSGLLATLRRGVFARGGDRQCRRPLAGQRKPYAAQIRCTIPGR